VTGSCPSGIPSTWNCSDLWYNSLDGCDCDCGTFDPDCNNPYQIIWDCPGTCNNADGNCDPVDLKDVPDTWDTSICTAESYNNSDGCDCGCGATDPDCATTLPLDQGNQCDYGWVCFKGVCTNPNVPDTWINCETYKWNETAFEPSNSTCDCGCGGDDPDCSNTNLEITHCPCSDMTCDFGVCVGICNDVNVTRQCSPNPPSNPNAISQASLGFHYSFGLIFVLVGIKILGWS